MMFSPGPHDDAMFSRQTIPSIPEDRIYEQAIDEEEVKDNGDRNNENENHSPFLSVNIEKTSAGFGFHIVGGFDCPHLKNDLGIFISTVNPQSKSYGVVQTGDKILSFDGIDMTCKSHDDAVDVFRKVQVGHVARLLIDRSYEYTEDRTQTPSTTTQSFRELNNKRNSVKSDSSSESRGRLTPHGVNTIVEKLRGSARVMNSYDDEDAQSVTSYAPSTHSIIDDVPRTPRKPLSILDPRNNSLFTEALYVSIGLGAITIAGLLAYRFVRGARQ